MIEVRFRSEIEARLLLLDHFVGDGWGAETSPPPPCTLHSARAQGPRPDAGAPPG